MGVLTYSDEIIDPENLGGNGGGGGSDLPKVTSADNGKVLKVIAGVWNKGDDVGFAITDLVPAYSTNTSVSNYYLTGSLVSYSNPAILANEEPKIYRANTTVYKKTNGDFNADDWDLIGTYDTTETYAYPDYTVYEGTLYQAKSGQTGITGTWDPTKWDSKYAGAYSETTVYTEGSVCNNTGYYQANKNIPQTDREFKNSEWDEISYDVAIREWCKPFQVARYEVKTGDTSTTDADGLLAISSLIPNFMAMEQFANEKMVSQRGYVSSVVAVKVGAKTYPLTTLTNDVSVELVTKWDSGAKEYIRFRKKDGTLYTSTGLTSILPVGACLMFYAFNLWNANEFETFKEFPVSN